MVCGGEFCRSFFPWLEWRSSTRMAESETIRLDQFLKLCSAVSTGGEAKMLIQMGVVLVNGEVETRRRRQLVPGDRVTIHGEDIFVMSDDDSED